MISSSLIKLESKLSSKAGYIIYIWYIPFNYNILALCIKIYW